MRYITRDLSPGMMPKNDAWRRERKLIHEAVSIANNAKYQGFMSDEATLALKQLLGDPKDFSNAFTRFSYGVLTRSLLGFRVSSAEDQFIVETEHLIEKSLKTFRPDSYPSNVFPFLRYLPSWALKSLTSLEELRKLTDDDITRPRKRLERELKSGTALTSVYRHFLENRCEYDVSDDEAGFAFQSMIRGGTRSPYNSLMSFCYLMMEHPEWFKKLQNQIEEVVGSERLPKTEDIPHLPIARAIVKEGIRYRSIVAELGVPHKLEENDVYEGYFFSKGTIFHANYGLILMDKEMYPDQKPFNPARWLEPSYPTYREPLTQYPNFQNFAPFGYGRRACPGYDFAERSLVIMIAKMAWCCNIKKPIDPITGEPIALDIKYEPVPNPKPYPFPCDISVRSEERLKILEMEAGLIIE